MFTKLEIRNPQGDLLTLQLGDDSNGIDLLDIAGLDPVKATLTSSDYAEQDGSAFQSARRGSRNITFKLSLNPDPAVMTVRALRKLIYSMFRVKKLVSMKFYVDDVDDTVEDGYLIVGYVESCLSPMFGTNAELTLDVSVICNDPDFTDPVPIVTSMTTADAEATYFPYEGTSDTGVTFTLNINRPLLEFVIYYIDANSAVWTMDVASSFLAGDVVTISTVPGNKGASLLRAGVTSSILYAISPQSHWPQLQEGSNWLRVVASGAAIPMQVSYMKRFGEL